MRASAGWQLAHGTSLRVRDLAFIVAAAAGATYFLTTEFFVSADFRNSLWGPSHQLLHGRSPYQVFQDNWPLWSPTIIGLLFPLGWLPAQQASNVWLLANVGIATLIAWRVGPASGPTRFGLALAALLAFPAIASHLYMGQATLLMALLFMLAARQVPSGRPWLAGMLVAAALAKPQLALLVVPGLLLAWLHSGRRAAPAVFVAAALAGSSLLTLPLWLVYPAWPTDYLAVLPQNQGLLQPTPFRLLPEIVDQLGLPLWAVLAVCLGMANAWLWLNLPSKDAVNWALALTPLVSPYLWSYDFALLAPLLASTIFVVRPRAAGMTLAVGFLACCALMIWIRVAWQNADHLYWWVPVWLLATICGARLMNGSASGLPTAVGRAVAAQPARVNGPPSRTQIRSTR